MIFFFSLYVAYMNFLFIRNSYLFWRHGVVAGLRKSPPLSHSGYPGKTIRRKINKNDIFHSGEQHEEQKSLCSDKN